MSNDQQNADSTHVSSNNATNSSASDNASNRSASSNSLLHSQRYSEALSCGKFPYNGDPATLGARWEEWLERWELSVLANSLTDGPSTRAAFLLQMGSEATAIWRTKRKTAEDTLAEIKAVMTAYFVPKRSEYAEVCKFRRAMRLEGETVGDYVMRLRSLAHYCKFQELDKEIERQLVIGCGIPEFERDCCRTDDLTLEKAISLAQGYERCDVSVTGLHKPMESERVRGTINRLNNNNSNSNYNNSGANNGPYNYTRNGQDRGGSNRPQLGNHTSLKSANGDSQQTTTQQQQEGDICGNCGNWPHQNGERCPARGVECFRCHRLNHFGSMCRSKMEYGGAEAPQTQAQGLNTSQQTADSHARSGRTIKHVDFQGLGNEPEEENYEVNSQEYAEFLRYKSASVYLSAISEHEPMRPARKGPSATVDLFGKRLTCLVDTGSPLNVMDEATFRKMAIRPKLSRCNRRYFGYSACTPVQTLGQFTARVGFMGRWANAGFIVVAGQSGCLLSFGTAHQLGVVHLAEQLPTKCANQATGTENLCPKTSPAALGQETGHTGSSANHSETACPRSDPSSTLTALATLGEPEAPLHYVRSDYSTHARAQTQSKAHHWHPGENSPTQVPSAHELRDPNAHEPQTPDSKVIDEYGDTSWAEGHVTAPKLETVTKSRRKPDLRPKIARSAPTAMKRSANSPTVSLVPNREGREEATPASTPASAPQKTRRPRNLGKNCPLTDENAQQNSVGQLKKNNSKLGLSSALKRSHQWPQCRHGATSAESKMFSTDSPLSREP